MKQTISASRGNNLTFYGLPLSFCELQMVFTVRECIWNQHFEPRSKNEQNHTRLWLTPEGSKGLNDAFSKIILLTFYALIFVPTIDFMYLID